MHKHFADEATPLSSAFHPWITVQCECTLEETMQLISEELKFNVCLVSLL